MVTLIILWNNLHYPHCGAYDPGASAASENPLGGEFRIDHCDSAAKASPVEVEERVS